MVTVVAWSLGREDVSVTVSVSVCYIVALGLVTVTVVVLIVVVRFVFCIVSYRIVSYRRIVVLYWSTVTVVVSLYTDGDGCCPCPVVFGLVWFGCGRCRFVISSLLVW